MLYKGLIYLVILILPVLFTRPSYGDSTITHVTATNTSGNVFLVEGDTTLPLVYAALKSPDNNITSYQITTQQSPSTLTFKQSLYLRYGPGTYTMYFGDNPKHFDGGVTVTMLNTTDKVTQYTDPSGYVDSDSITEDYKTVRSVHDFVAKSLTYDYAGYVAGKNDVNKASDILAKGSGMCRDYAILFAAVARKNDIPTQVVYGTVKLPSGEILSHAWNRVLINNTWTSVDTTFDSGYIKAGKFVHKLIYTSPNDIDKTHTVTGITTF